MHVRMCAYNRRYAGETERLTELVPGRLPSGEKGALCSSLLWRLTEAGAGRCA
jgi:hypothetical protein